MVLGIITRKEKKESNTNIDKIDEIIWGPSMDPWRTTAFIMTEPVLPTGTITFSFLLEMLLESQVNSASRRLAPFSKALQNMFYMYVTCSWLAVESPGIKFDLYFDKTYVSLKSCNTY